MDARGRARTLHTAWVRADGIVRDHKLGVMDKLVRAGLRQVMIGVERDDAEGLAVLGKHHNGAEVCREAFAILRQRVSAGLHHRHGDLRPAGRPHGRPPPPGRVAVRAGHGLLLPHPADAQPRHGLRRSAVSTCAGADLARYNFHTPVMPTATLDLRQLESLYWRLMFRPSRRRLAMTGRQLLLERDRRKRRVTMALLGRARAIALRSLLRRAVHPASKEPALHSRKPPWYDD